MTDNLTQALNKILGNDEPVAQKTQPKQPRTNAPRKKQQPAQAVATNILNNEDIKVPSVKAAPVQSRAPRQPQTRTKASSKSRQMPATASAPLTIMPLGGLGEIGKNMTLYSCQNDMFLVDCGTVFPDQDMFGVDLVIPDFTTVLEHKDKIKGLVITHGHEDHIGSIPYLLREFNVPIYATRLAAGLIKNKLSEHNLLDSARITEISSGFKFKLGCFTIDPIHVNHSIPDAVALAITCPAGVVIQTGDFKIDYTPISGRTTDLASFAEYGSKGVLALLSDSTNAERPGISASESKVGEAFKMLFSKAENKRIIVATFASNIQRIQQIFDMAAKYDRKVAVSGRSMINNTRMAVELGYLKLANENMIIDIDQVNKYPPEKVAIVTTGSQGEPLSALSRMGGGSHRQVRIGAGDFIILSAKPIPGNEKTVSRVVNSLLKQGAEVIYESMYDVHTSGHACQEELKLMLNLVKPKYFIPVHGEFKQLYKHSQLAVSMGVASENVKICEIGDTIIMNNNCIRLGDPVQAGRVLVDGLGVGDIGNVVLRDRRHLSQDGLVIVVATVDSVSGDIISGPEIVSRGFVYVRESEALIDEAKNTVCDILEACQSGELSHDWNAVKTRIREQLSHMMYRRTKRSPMILPIIMEV